jgi:hypothetical protein
LSDLRHTAELPGARRRLTALQLAAWLILAVVVFSTLSPIGLRPLSPFGPNVERFLAFGAVGGAFALAYERRFLRTAILLIAAALALELGQRLIPGRHGELRDLIIKLAGAAIGLGFGRFGAIWIAQRRTRRSSR